MTKRQKPDKPLRVLVIGCGRASRDHLRAIAYFEKRGYLTLAGLVDRDSQAMSQVIQSRGSHMPVPAVSGDAGAMFAKKTFDLTVIATPPSTHAALAQKALTAGTHLIVEKPLTLDAGQADMLVLKAKECGRTLATGLKYRYIPGVFAIKSWIESGHLGEILYGTATVLWGHDQAYYDQADWFGTWSAEGGALMNQSIHALDLMAWLMDARPVEATAVLARQCHDIEAADLVMGILSLEGNRFLLLEGTTNTDPSQHEASFFLRCERGTVRASFVGGKPKVSVMDDDGKQYGRGLMLEAVRQHVRREGVGVLRQVGNPYTFLYADMLDAIVDGRPPIAPGEAGRDSLMQALALLHAGRMRQTVPFPAEHFRMEDMAGYFD
ncbi:MAG TPA: Gfo/Idh/MocA family oxidoreductase [Clostridia bacterium]|nr:Gfo/Idh/MocA family oxidoreductase [Clostridia bacterium]